MKQRLQRILSILCVLALLAGCVTVTAFAAEATVAKAIVIEWDDEGYEGLRPGSISASFGNNEPVTLNSGNNWSGSIEVAAGSGTGWVLQDAPDTYTSSTSGTADVTVFTLSYKVETADPVSVSVLVIDSIAAPSGQPTSARISLLADKDVCRPPEDVAISDGRGAFTWRNLPQYKVQGTTPAGHTVSEKFFPARMLYRRPTVPNCSKVM